MAFLLLGAAIVVFGALMKRDQLLERYHYARLQNDDVALGRALVAAPDRPAARALKRFLTEASSRKRLSQFFVERAIAELANANAGETHPLQPNELNEMTVGLSPLYEGAAEEWWLVYRGSFAGQHVEGSRRASEVILALARILEAHGSVDAFDLPADPRYDVHFAVRLRDARPLAGDWFSVVNSLLKKCFESKTGRFASRSVAANAGNLRDFRGSPRSIWA